MSGDENDDDNDDGFNDDDNRNHLSVGRNQWERKKWALVSKPLKAKIDKCYKIRQKMDNSEEKEKGLPITRDLCQGTNKEEKKSLKSE